MKFSPVINRELKFVKLVLSKTDITMATIKNFEINKSRILRDLDLLRKIEHDKLKV